MRIIFTIFFLCIIFNLYSQQVPISGVVQSANEDIPLAGATIAIQGTSISTSTDKDGMFEILSPEPEGILYVSYIGYDAQEVPFSQVKEPITIQLNTTQNTVDEVQIIGYGETSKRFNTGSVSSISAKEIEQQPVTNVLSALSGRMPGVFVQTTNGLPGGNINIQIRGTGSIAAGTEPLYIVDGIPFETGLVPEGHVIASGSLAGRISPLNSLNPSDIENITVLKDADATAIYGSRGSNGVVLITTKRNKQTQTQINVSAQHGINKAANFPNLLNLEEYLEMRREAFENDGLIPSADANSDTYAPDLMEWGTSSYTNWGEYLFGGTGHVSNYQVGVSGGTTNTSFNLSGNYRQESTFLAGDNKYKRGSVHAGIHHQSNNKKFEVSFSTIFSNDHNKLANLSPGMNLAVLTPPNMPVYDAKGDYYWYRGNPKAQIDNTSSTSQTNNLVTHFNIGYEIMSGLTLKTSMGYNHISMDRKQVFPKSGIHPGIINYSHFGINASESFIVEPQLLFREHFNLSNLTVLLGATFQNKTNDGTFIEASNFPSESLMENLASAGSIDTKSTTFQQYKYVSVYGRATYIWKQKYVINGTVRRDGSSKFGPNNRFGNFGAIGLSWLFKEEPFFKKTSFLSYGKLRASAGVTGNDQISDYQYLSTYGNSYLIYEDIAGLNPQRAFNPDFKWESTTKWEGGLELGFLDNDILLNVDYYYNQSNTQLVNYSLPRMTGFASYQANLPAEVVNSGWEIELTTQNISKDKFSWNTSLNVTFPKNELKSFDDFEQSSYSKTLEIGYDITRIYGKKFLGVDPSTGQASYLLDEESTSSIPYSYYRIGKATPDFYGGLGNTLRYRDFSLDIFLQFSKQLTKGGIDFSPGLMYNQYKIALQRWRKAGDKAIMPKSSTSNDSYYATSDINYFDVPYLRIKNIAISYSLPRYLLNPFNISGIRLYLEGQNLFTFWNNDLPLLDPESGANTSTQRNLPPARSFIAGIQITL